MKYKLNASILNRAKKPQKISDGHRLFFKRNADGSLTAFQRITVGGKDREIALDTFLGDLTTGQLDAVRKKGYALKSGAPVDEGYTGITLERLWEKYLEGVSATRNGRWSERTTIKNTQRVENHIAPTAIWRRRVSDIRTPQVIEALRPLRQSKPATEEKIRIILNKLFQHAITMQATTENPIPAITSHYSTFEKPLEVKHFAARTDFAGLREVLTLNDDSPADLIIRQATRFQALTAQRTGNIVSAKWVDIDLEAGTWTIPRADMKVKDKSRGDHVVPLSTQAVTLLGKVEKRGDYVFTSKRSAAGHITANALPKHYRDTLKLGDNMTPHGWRSGLKTLARDAVTAEGSPMFAEAWIKAAMDHVPGNATDQAYVRQQAVNGAARVLQWWADQLEESGNA